MLAIAAADVLAAGGDWVKAAPSMFRVVNQFRRDRDEAARTALAALSARLMTALIATSMLDEPQLRASADELRGAIVELLRPATNVADRQRQAANL
ncbi:hypothetical protein [Amycolatopsis saalfeldensis]|uniref:hypothetical protein n=1 Tax=Amycolatopsis saalfeldensis TaxID=394193 RepID=UPI0011604FCC|nr:hypothetical protein [Amycolatopsis saalfeldensis]